MTEPYVHPDGDPLARAARWIDDAKNATDPEGDFGTAAAGAAASIASAIALVEIARLLRPLPPEVAEANVAELRESAVDALGIFLRPRTGIVGAETPADRAVFVLPAVAGELDLRLLRVGIVDQVEQWFDAEKEVDSDLVDRLVRLVRRWVEETNR